MCDLNDIVAVQDGDDWGDEPGREGTWLVFERPVEIVRAGCVGEVGAALERVERATRDEGLWAAGWIAYEAAPAFDAACCVRKTPTSGEARDAAVGPLVWFGLFDAAPRRIEGDPAGWRPGGAYYPRGDGRAHRAARA